MHPQRQPDGFVQDTVDPVPHQDNVLLRLNVNVGGTLAHRLRQRQRDGRYLIVDLAVEGVSMALTRRQEFSAVIRAAGGNIDGLIARLKNSNT